MRRNLPINATVEYKIFYNLLKKYKDTFHYQLAKIFSIALIRTKFLIKENNLLKKQIDDLKLKNQEKYCDFLTRYGIEYGKFDTITAIHFATSLFRRDFYSNRLEDHTRHERDDEILIEIGKIFKEILERAEGK